MTATTTQNLIANALNNFTNSDEKFYPQETINKNADFMERMSVKFGWNVVSIDTVSQERQLEVLNTYLLESDFSAFKKCDVENAISSLTKTKN